MPERPSTVTEASKTETARGYLDTPSMGLPTAGTVRAMASALDDWAHARADYTAWERSMANCRDHFATIAGVAAADVGLLPSVVPAISAAARHVAARGGTVVAHRAEFRSLLLPVLAQVDESRMRWVDGPYVADTFSRAVDDDTGAVLVSAVASHDGGRPALATIAAACRAHDAHLVVDGTQAAGLVVPDVAPDELALFACAGYKGLRGPRGVAFAVAREEVVAGFAAPSAYAVADIDQRGTYGPPLAPKPGAQGLDQSPAWLCWVGAEPALAELARQPATERQGRVLALAESLRERLVELGLPPQPTDLPSPIVTFPVADPPAVLGALADAGISAAAKLGRIRVGFHVYNDLGDVDRLCAVLRRCTH